MKLSRDEAEIQKAKYVYVEGYLFTGTATKNAAHVCNLEDELGTLQAGKAADVLVVRGDPLGDLDALTNVRLVIHDGVVIRAEP